MKKILALASLLLAFNGYAQSYMIMGTGVTLTLDKAGYVYDFSHFIPPYKVTLNGGQFFAEEGKFVSIDTNGYLYRKDEKVPSRVKGKGSNYLLAENGTLYTFDDAGFLYEFDKESAFKKAITFGGNFFVATDLYTINNKGNFYKMNVAGLNPADIITTGGSYFRTMKGTVYTVNKDGLVFSKENITIPAIKKTGGNFFIDTNSVIYTVSDEGILSAPVLPSNLKVAAITKLGQNYMLDQDGNLFVVDGAGAVYSREIKEHNLKDAKVISLQF